MSKSDSNSFSENKRKISISERLTPLLDDDKPPLLFVFDIDETLIQFINRKAFHYWKNAQEEHPEKMARFDYIEKQSQVIIFRPFLAKFLQFVKRNLTKIKIALWTYSDAEYAEGIAEALINHYNLPEDIFEFVYSNDEIMDHSIPKSLQQIWDSEEFGERFNKFNTILVDDRLGNLCHEINKENSIVIQGFEPFGATKSRESFTEKNFKEAIHDRMFIDLITVAKKIIRDIQGCSQEDIDVAFKTESVLQLSKISRKGLQHILQKISHDGKEIEICALGNIERATSLAKGGRRTRKKMTLHKSPCGKEHSSGPCGKEHSSGPCGKGTKRNRSRIRLRSNRTSRIWH
jgi:hypothetical protein